MRPEIVAELSCNHQGSLERALRLVDAAAASGATAIKVQCWQPDYMVGPKGYRLPDGPWKGRDLADLYAEAHTPWSWIPAIFERARGHNLGRQASVFDHHSLRYLEDIDCPRYKIASFELVDIPLIQAVAATGKPMTMSVGMATEAEIQRAVIAARTSGCRDLELLHCVSAYPTHPVDMSLSRIPKMRELYGCAVGLSDHSLSNAAASAAVALGATTIEKHFILERSQGGPDAAFSIEPLEMRQLARDCHDVYWAMRFTPSPGTRKEEEPQRQLRRSAYWARDMVPGERIESHHILMARPALGLAPKDAMALPGRIMAERVTKGTPISLEHVRPETVDYHPV